jgi:hypothetical protein
MARAFRRTSASIFATVFGMNALFTRMRSLVWRGASMLIIEAGSVYWGPTLT